MEAGAEGDRITVLYLIAKGRSGSNVLAHFLGQLEGWCNTGELYHLWKWGLEEGARCGCGKTVPECELWSKVAERMLGEYTLTDVQRWQDEILTWRSVPRLARLDPKERSSWDAVDRYCRVRASLYHAIAEESGARVLVDASKWPWDPVALGLVPEVRPVVVHLVRDPRAVAHSWRRRKSWGDHDDGATEMPRFSAGYSALSWLARNAATEWTHRKSRGVPWMLVRYEDFVGPPARDPERYRRARGPSGGGAIRRRAHGQGAPDARGGWQPEQVLARRRAHRPGRGVADGDVRPRPVGDDGGQRPASLALRLRVHFVGMTPGQA